MRRRVGLFAMYVFCGALFGLVVLVLPRSSAAQSPVQSRPSTDAAKEYAPTGELTVQVQDTTGAPFFQGARVTLLTRAIDERLLITSDPSGRARFTALPVGAYLIEIAAPGYRTVQEQVLITGTREVQDIVVSMVPTASDAKVKIGSSSVSLKAVKESEKALHALQLNKLEDAQQHVARALAFDPDFADGNYLMGVLLLRQKQFGKARAYLQKSLILSPEHTAALLALGEAQYLEQDYSHATESLEKFLRDQPQSPQAPIAKKYVDAMHKLRPQAAADNAEAVAATSRSSSLADGGPKAPDGSVGATNPGLPPLPDITPATETNWAPPDVDDENLGLDSTTPCQLDVVQSAGRRVEQLVRDVDRYTATENLEHFELSPMGLKISRETRKFNYLVEIHQVGKSDLNVQEYRSGWAPTEKIRGYPAREEFPGNIATVGLPTLALVFHPYFQTRYDFRCEGHGSWQGKSVWVVHFQQRPDRSSGMLVYNVGRHSVNVGLKGRAWIDAANSQILAMESDIMRPAPEIRLLRDHQLIEYGPVSFRQNSTQLWLPKSADWYCNISGHRFHR
ncbi:MAG TPA: carboxypeptidase regulatory-like domain-containing protein, partial [Candidatus Methylomirabilis sp.]|nr:carboxypeptidase regulatory-like domain-containing protein [Candidatus Methylomirabilis sp.]